MHTIDNLLDLGRLQILHEVVVHDGLLDQLTRPVTTKENEILICVPYNTQDLSWPFARELGYVLPVLANKPHEFLRQAHPTNVLPTSVVPHCRWLDGRKRATNNINF